MASRVDACGLVLHVQRNGYVRLDVRPGLDVSSSREVLALRRWLRDWPEHSLNECDHTPFTCATFDAEPKRRPCGCCGVREALGLPPMPGKPRAQKEPHHD